MGVRVCKSVCIEEKISGREVADYVASKEQNATPNSCDQQPPSAYFLLYTHGLTYTNPHSDTLALDLPVNAFKDVHWNGIIHFHIHFHLEWGLRDF